jgi:hypothetical protein
MAHLLSWFVPKNYFPLLCIRPANLSVCQDMCALFNMLNEHAVGSLPSFCFPVYALSVGLDHLLISWLWLAISLRFLFLTLQRGCPMALNILLCSFSQPVKVCCADRLSSTWYGSVVLPQCMLCINRLAARCWFDCIHPL